MAPSYYVIELTGRWLAILLAALALVMVLAFAFGYGAAWSVLSERPAEPRMPAVPGAATATPTPAEVVIPATVEQPTPKAAPTRVPTATPVPATPTARPKPTEKPAKTEEGFWVQVLASTNASAVEEARRKLAEAGFDRQHQMVTRSPGPGGNELLKLRVGPFPDRPSADRVVVRMKGSGFSDAWVVAP
jgi:cell division septation protein DedD